MRVEWYGQSAFRLAGADATVFVDPFGDTSSFAGRGIQFDYPAIEGLSADLVLVTHEHHDHNGAEAIEGDPAVLRLATWPRESPLGEVVAIASEHDAVAGTERGPNTIFRFELDGLAICHFGDFGQSALREEQAHAIVVRIEPRWVVPMHYRTPRVGFLETADAFLELMPEVLRLEGTAFETGELPEAGRPLAVVPAAP
jgi:L-ascorbate metabolism protein UlaG (beta-lactamase superfamily)